MKIPETPVIDALRQAFEVLWRNPKPTPCAQAEFGHPLNADPVADATHILWATGGRLVPESVRAACRETYL